MEILFKTPAQAKIFILPIFILSILSFGCYAQENNTLLKSVEINGSLSNIVSDAAIIESPTLSYSIYTFLELKNESDIKSLLGEPLQENDQNDESNTGIVLFELKQLIYDGLIFNLEKSRGVFEIISIELIDKNTILSFNSNVLKIGGRIIQSSNNSESSNYRINITDSIVFEQSRIKSLSTNQIKNQYFKLGLNRDGFIESITLIIKTI